MTDQQRMSVCSACGTPWVPPDWRCADHKPNEELNRTIEQIEELYADETNNATWQAANLERLVAAGAFNQVKLSDQAERILRWAAGWDEWTIQGPEELFIAARKTS